MTNNKTMERILQFKMLIMLSKKYVRDTYRIKSICKLKTTEAHAALELSTGHPCGSDDVCRAGSLIPSVHLSSGTRLIIKYKNLIEHTYKQHLTPNNLDTLK